MAELAQLPGVLDLSIYRGDNTNFRVTLKDPETGDPLVLPTTGWRAQVREERTSTTILFTLTVDATGAGSGVVGLSILGADTAGVGVDAAAWDMENTDLDRTYLAGKIKLKGEVSR